MVSWPMKSRITAQKDGFVIETSGMPKSDNGDYVGPTCHVYADKDWLYVSTDEYEGTAMLNIEALPALRRALGMVAKQIRAQSHSATKSE